MYLWEKLRKDLEKVVGLEIKDSDFGDFTAKSFNKKPKTILKKVKLPVWVTSEIKGSYINFHINWSKMGQKIIDEVQKKDYGKQKQGKNILLEYSSPNIAKPMHVGHLRNTILGISFVKIFEFLGNKVRKVNWYGDTGTQFGKLILAYKLCGNEFELLKNPTKEMMRVYVKFHQESKKNESLEDNAREVYKGLEEGNKEFTKLWKKFTKLSLKEFKRIYKILNAEFDNYDGESKYSDMGKDIIEKLKKKKLAKKGEDGAWIVNFDNLSTTIIQKKDGTTLYLTRDVATAIDRKKEYGFDRMIYVVGPEQILHFKQLFKTLELLGLKWAKECYHVYYGYVSLPEGKMSTREGKVIFAEDVINESLERAKKINKKVAKEVGLSALNYSILKVEPKRDIIFNWDEMLRLKGNTGPYLQYSAVRAKHIFEKAKISDFKWPEIEEEEKKLLRKMAQFPQIVENAGDQFKPNLIANYAHELAEIFNSFYEKIPVLKEVHKDKRNFRLVLVKSVHNILEKAMFLLNIQVPEKM